MSLLPVAMEFDLPPAAVIPNQNGTVITTVLTSGNSSSSAQHFVRAEGYQVINQYFDIKTNSSGAQLRRSCL